MNYFNLINLYNWAFKNNNFYLVDRLRPLLFELDKPLKENVRTVGNYSRKITATIPPKKGLLSW